MYVRVQDFFRYILADLTKTFQICVCLLILLSPKGYSAETSVDASIRLAYEQIMALKLDDARSSIATIDKDHPTFAAIHLSNYVDMVDLLVTENESNYKKLKSDRSSRIDRLEDIESSSPYQLYVQGEIYLQWAIVKLKYQDYYSGFRDVSRAYRLFKENQTKHPDFVLNQKGLGTIETLVGMIPDNLRWGVKLLTSLNGNTESGLAKLKYAYDNIEGQSIFKSEVGIIYSYLLLHYGNQKDHAWNIIESLNLDMKKPIHLYVKASTARYVGKNDLAIDLLTKYETETSINEFPYLTYLLGVALLNRLDKNAGFHLEKYVSQSGAIHYIKDAYMRLSWTALINGNTKGYLHYIDQIKLMGESRIDYDKVALRYAESRKAPQVDLLKARLLYDGGYYNRAETLLLDVASQNLSNQKHRLEYTYRLGRIYQAQNDNLAALKYFGDTIEAGRLDESYYACNSALQMGLIYESMNKIALAKSSFRKCLSMKPSDYRYSLHLKAKSGLRRIQ